MKISYLLAVALFAAIACHAQPAPFPPRPAPMPSQEAVKPSANYVIRVEWKAAKEDSKFLEVLTAEGSFNLDTIQKASVKINNNEIPTTLKLSGSLTPIDDAKGKLQLFLGRTVPYVTGTYGPNNTSSSYSQMSVGLNSTFLVHFDKSEVVQSDENGEISVLVKRVE